VIYLLRLRLEQHVLHQQEEYSLGELIQAPTRTNVIQYVTIASAGNTTDFGDLQGTFQELSGCSNSTRGIFANGFSDAAGGPTNVIQQEMQLILVTVGNNFFFKCWHGIFHCWIRFGGGRNSGTNDCN
jgi:hypothetical protein